MSRPLRFSIRTYLLAVASVAVLFFSTGLSTVSAQADACGDARVVIMGGEPSPYLLPDDAGTTFRVDPEATLRITAEGVPPDARVRWGIAGLGSGFVNVTRDIGSGSADFDLSDYSGVLRGLYSIDLTLLDGSDEPCEMPFDIRVGDFGGPVATGAAVGTAVGGVGAAASAPLAANGMNAKLSLKVQTERRRPRGLRRFVPVPAWKRTVISTLIGAFVGLCVTVLLQQGGVTPLSLATAGWGLVTGGGATFGLGYTLGAIRTFTKPPEVPPEVPPEIPGEEPEGESVEE